jgi:hypothetical protein
MRSKILNTPTGKWLVESGLEYYLPPMGYCTACGRGFFNQPPNGPSLTYCGCLGGDIRLRQVPRLFCPGCGNRKRCRCPGGKRRQRRGVMVDRSKVENNRYGKSLRMAVGAAEDHREWFPIGQKLKTYLTGRCHF